MNMKNFKRPYSQHGFSLIEMMVVVVIVAIATAIALPNYRAFVVKSRSSANAALLHGVLTDAKNLSRVRGAVTICKTDNPDAATPACSSVVSNATTNVGWGSGWISFIDSNADGIYNAGDTLLKVQPPLLLKVSEGSIVPVPQTQSITIGGVGRNMYFYIKPPDEYVGATYDRYVCLTTTGLVRVVKTLPC